MSFGEPISRTERAATSGLVVPRAQMAAIFAEAMDASGTSNVGLARRLGIDEAVVRRWQPNPETGAVEKPLPALITLVAPDRLSEEIKRLTADARAARRQTALDMLRAAAVCVEREGFAEAELPEARALHALIGTAAYGGGAKR